ncbi:MAG: protein-(glutamine-N5) methyltransferase, release factor-specific [Legionellales bacterium]|nr:protein-(glutamine-N5) methyltransferase, release factor-specific [Legionellales bacterium]|tara:strand:- start:3103 stop:3939 length:837 start_codon:yes stop_codon:yes gene_type:complete
MQIANAIKYAQQQFVKSDSARLDAEVLICSVLKCERIHLYTYPEKRLSNTDLSSFKKLIKLRIEGHPIAHLIQKREFWSLDLKVTIDTLIPRPETEILVEAALDLIPKELPHSILELGTGTGAISIAIASSRNLARITATDIKKAALDVAISNAKSYQLSNINFENANWFDMKDISTYDLIISNPPYICIDDPHLGQGDVRFEPESALVSGKEGLDDLRIIITGAKNYLNNNGWLLVEHGHQQGKTIKQLLKNNNYSTISTLKDYSNLDRIGIGQWVL